MNSGDIILSAINLFSGFWDLIAVNPVFITFFGIALASGIVRFIWRLGGEYV